MKQTLIRGLALLIVAVMLMGMVPVAVSASARAEIQYFGSADTPLGAISANLQETPVYEEITESQKDLSGYKLPPSSRYPTATVMPDTWVFTDGLGRVSLTNADVGDPREDKTVAMFFWNWHTQFKDQTPFNVQKYMDEQTAKGIAPEEYVYDFDHEGWNIPGKQTIYFWDEPIYGFYASDDTWVARRQAELLSYAGVDTVFSDTTNGTNTWKSGYDPVMSTWVDAQKDGVNTPKFSFMLPFWDLGWNATQIGMYYDDIYQSGKYQSLWFYWEGKPMLMAHGATALEDDDPKKSFFTFRGPQPGYAVTETRYSEWGWLHNSRQAPYYKNKDEKAAGIIEQMTVGVAQNASYSHKGALTGMNSPTAQGRAYDSKRKHLEEEDGYLWGYNFAEQFEYAIRKDPKVIFVTGWNEWNCWRIRLWPESGAQVSNAFPDTFNAAYSRDLEPSRGVLADHYYYQLVNYVRQYKGANPIPTPSKAATIDLTQGYDQWQSVEPYYAAYIGNTGDRDAVGYGGIEYKDFSGRNDIIGAQVARDGENLWFLVECAADITPYTDKLWMNLYIDVNTAEADDNAGWNTFDFVVNKTAPTETAAVLEKFTDGYTSEKVADVEYKVDGRYMTVKIPKSALGIEGEEYTVNFAWTDNVHDVADTGTGEGDATVYSTFSGDILDFYTSGDVAPGGRFKFSFVSTTENSGVAPETEAPTETPTDPAETPTEAPSETESDTEVPQKGCKSSIFASAVLLSAMAAAVALRKKED